MNNSFLIRNATIINEGLSVRGSLFITNGNIQRIYNENEPLGIPDCTVIEANGKWVLPGAIDTHVHFREPGATYKADIASESVAAVAGGITSYMDMPNNTPAITTLELLETKNHLAAATSLANYAFYLGTGNENIQEIKRLSPKQVCGVKVFLGSSTGNMLVDNEKSLSAIFAESPVTVAVHCEDEAIIRHNLTDYKTRYDDRLTARFHPLIRTEEACIRSTERAIRLAERYATHLHVLHVTTAKETTLFSKNDRITAEACIPHLWFYDEAYERLRNLVKCNPAIKTKEDRDALRKAVSSGVIATIATDHAPHTLAEKEQPYLSAPSGMPGIQFSLPLLLELCRQKIFTPEIVVERMCHRPAKLFHIEKRGFIREGYRADLIIVDPEKEWTITNAAVLSKCRWTPYAGTTVHSQITHTFVNGRLAYENGHIYHRNKGEQLTFDR